MRHHYDKDKTSVPKAASSDSGDLDSRNPSLDSLYGLRGLAALSIVLFHFIPNVQMPPWAQFMRDYFGLGVQLFFVLSAFSLCYTTSAYVGRGGWVDRYFWKRFFRIAPPFWAILLFYSVFNHYQWGLSFFDQHQIANLLFIFNFLPGNHESAVMAGWTVGVEVIFYAFFPMLLMLVHNATRATVFFALAAICLVVGRGLLLQTSGIPRGDEHTAFITNVIYFAAGMLAYWLFANNRNLSRDWRFISGAPVVAALLVGSLLWTPLGAFLQAGQSYGVYVAVTFGFFTVWLALRPDGILATPYLVWCGKRSYSVYLVHAVVVWKMTPVYGWIHAQIANADIAFILSAMAALTGALLVGEIFHRLVESPSIAIGKRFETGAPFREMIFTLAPLRLLRPYFSKVNGTSASDWVLRLLAVAAGLHAAWLTIHFASQPLLESYGFRQTQTALTAFWMLRDGWHLSYETPVAGYPWAIPFEFPIYQGLAASLVSVTGVGLGPAGRLISFGFLAACAWPAFSLVRRLGMPRRTAWVFCALLWTSPLYLFWGRTFMIETAAIFFAFAALSYAPAILAESPCRGALALFSLFASLAVLQKITTGGPVLAIVAVLWAVNWLRRGGLRCPHLRDVSVALVAFGLPVLLAYLWVRYSDLVKMENPLGAQLTSATLAKWNYGTLDQRLQLSTYKSVLWERGFVLNACGFLGLALIAAALFVKLRRIRGSILLALALYLLPVLAFTNLHVVHNYYQVGCVIFLIGALAIAVANALPELVHHPAVVPVATIILVAANLAVFGSGYGVVTRRHIDQSSTSQDERALLLGAVLRKFTPVDSGIVVLGNDWNSDIAYYSERRSLTAPAWYSQHDRIFSDPGHFLGGVELGAIVLCPQKGELGVEELTRKFESSRWRMVDVMGCRLLLPTDTALSEHRGGVGVERRSPIARSGDIDGIQ